MIIPFDIPNGPVLIAGAGGGFDFACGLPLVFELENKGHTVHIANLSFTHLSDIENGIWHNDVMLEVSADSVQPKDDYFPEGYLTQWYRDERNNDKSIFCFDRKSGVKPVLNSYNYLIEKFGINTVICIDGGVDGIFRGDEFDLATPSMDAISVVAASLCSAEQKIFSCCAFGTEGAEGHVSHAQALRRMSDLIRNDQMLGVGIVLKNSVEGKEFKKAIKYIFNKISIFKNSIIISTILGAMEGLFGRESVHARTESIPPWISPLTSMYWFFDATGVAKLKLYYADIIDSETCTDVVEAINRKRNKLSIQEYEEIPI